MKCSIPGCAGEYEARKITHTVKHRGQVRVIDHVPAAVCSACGDMLLSPDTIRHPEVLITSVATPDRTVPLYEYA